MPASPIGGNKRWKCLKGRIRRSEFAAPFPLRQGLQYARHSHGARFWRAIHIIVTGWRTPFDGADMQAVRAAQCSVCEQAMQNKAVEVSVSSFESAIVSQRHMRLADPGMRSASTLVSRRRDLAEFSTIEIINRVAEFFLTIHDKRPVACDRLIDRFTRQHK